MGPTFTSALPLRICATGHQYTAAAQLGKETNLAIFSIVTLAIGLTVFIGLRSLAFKNHRDLTSCIGYGVISGTLLAEIYLVFTTMS
jgi:hypothetical protein